MVVISGASGFVGRCLVRRLLEKYSPSSLHCLVRANDDSFGGTGTEHLRRLGVEPLPTELLQGTGLDHLQRPQILFHLAANTHTWERDQACNDVGTERLLRAIRPLGPEVHVIFTSTVAVMDNREYSEGLLHIDSELNGPPMSRYGLSKFRAEQFLKAEAIKQNFRLSIVRLSTVYGPEPRPNTFFDVLKREVTKQSLVSRLNWPGKTSFIHVDDVATCLLKLASDPPPPAKPCTYLLATESQTLNEVSRMLYYQAGIPFRTVELPNILWKLIRQVHWICRRGNFAFPSAIYNTIWRLNLIVNPVFHCDTKSMKVLFPHLKPRLMAESLQEI